MNYIFFIVLAITTTLVGLTSEASSGLILTPARKIAIAKAIVESHIEYGKATYLGNLRSRIDKTEKDLCIKDPKVINYVQNIKFKYDNTFSLQKFCNAYSEVVDLENGHQMYFDAYVFETEKALAYNLNCDVNKRPTNRQILNIVCIDSPKNGEKIIGTGDHLIIDEMSIDDAKKLLKP